MDGPLKANVIFEVRNDKLLGVLVLTIQCANVKVPHFFREHHQPLKQHPEQLQEIVKKKCPSVGYKKAVNVDVISFVREYYDGKVFEFKGVLLRSSAQQLDKVYDRKLNRQIGTQKRLQTIKESKQRKIDEKNKMIRDNLELAELKFQEERGKRLAELFGAQVEFNPSANQQHNVDPKQVQIDQAHPEDNRNPESMDDDI